MEVLQKKENEKNFTMSLEIFDEKILEAYDLGYESGYDDGYDNGHNDGQEDCQKDQSIEDWYK